MIFNIRDFCVYQQSLIDPPNGETRLSYCTESFVLNSTRLRDLRKEKT